MNIVALEWVFHEKFSEVRSKLLKELGISSSCSFSFNFQCFRPNCLRSIHYAEIRVVMVTIKLLLLV